MTKTFQTITGDEDAFIERFHPIVNHLNSNAAFDFGYGGCLFETYGDEFAFVRAQQPACIWTLVESDGILSIDSGLHIVNRLGYFVCERPSPHNERLSYRIDEAAADEMSS